MFTSSQNVRDFDNLQAKKMSSRKRLRVRIIHVSQTKGNNGLTSFLVEKNLTGKTLQVHLKVNLEPWIGQWYFEIHNFVKTLKFLTNDDTVEMFIDVTDCLLSTCYHVAAIGCGFCRYDITTADTDNLKSNMRQS